LIVRGFIAGEGISSTTARLILTDSKLIHLSQEPEFEQNSRRHFVSSGMWPHVVGRAVRRITLPSQRQ